MDGVEGKEGYVNYITLNDHMSDFHRTPDHMINGICATPRPHGIEHVFL